MKIKTSELTGAALDWAVELANGTHWSTNGFFVYRYAGCGPGGYFDKNPQWNYSTDWAQGGPIIEREVIELRFDSDMSEPIETDGRWYATMGPMYDPEFCYYGPTPLIAAMRCYVASKLGDEVDVPNELCAP